MQFIIQENILIDEARQLLMTQDVKAIAFVDRDRLVWLGYRDEYLKYTRLLSMSMAKSIASVAVGQAICYGKLSLDTFVKTLIPEFENKDLGQAKLKDLLTMSSGTWEGYPDSSIVNAQQRLLLQTGSINLLDILLSDKVSSAHRSLFSKRQPGQVFAYRSTDTLIAAIMLERAIGQPYSQFVDDQILKPSGISEAAILGRDFSGFPRADGVVRMSMMDWTRVAIWIGQQLEKQDCLGDYLRQATLGKIQNQSRAFPKNYKKYGYFFGTDHSAVPDSFWAVGFGGQRIGWSKKNGRIVVAFANSDRYLDQLYPIFDRWVRSN